MARNGLFNWSWDMRPATADEYDAMMVSLDRHLASLGLAPPQRPINATLVVSSAFGLLGTPIIGGSRDRGEPYSPADLLARVHDWYSDTYGDKTKIDFSPGSVVVSLHSNLWEMKMPKVWGSFDLFVSQDLSSQGNYISTKGSTPAKHNILLSVQGMTQAYASRLNKDDLVFLAGRFINSYPAIVCLDDLKGHDLFEEARGDYRHSVDALLTGRELGKARWDTAQCAEKILKGLLAREGHAFPTSGAKGHDISHLGTLITDKIGFSLLSADLSSVHCTAAVRYGEMKISIEDALAAHEALVRLLSALAKAEAHHTHWPDTL